MVYFESKLYELLPQGVRARDTNKDLESFCKILGTELDKLKDKIDNFLDLVDIDTMNEEQLDLFIELFGLQKIGDVLNEVDKRELVKNGVRLFKTKGTIYGIKKLAKILLGNIKVDIKPMYKNILHLYSPNNKYTTVLNNYGVYRKPEDTTGYLYSHTLPRKLQVWLELAVEMDTGLQYTWDKLQRFQELLPDYVSATTEVEVIFLGWVGREILNRINDSLSAWIYNDSGQELLNKITETFELLEVEGDNEDFGKWSPNSDSLYGIIDLDTGIIDANYLYNNRILMDKIEVDGRYDEVLEKPTENTMICHIIMQGDSIKDMVLNTGRFTLNSNKFPRLWYKDKIGNLQETSLEGTMTKFTHTMVFTGFKLGTGALNSNLSVLNDSTHVIETTQTQEVRRYA